MNSDFLTQLWNAPSLITFLDEIVILLGILLVNELKKKKRFATIPKSFFDGLHSILLVTMPSIALFSTLAETQFPIYLSVLVFLAVFLGWYCRLFLKHDDIPKTLTGIFIGLLLFIIVFYGILYSIFR
jgi:hypothetical protein